MIRRKTLSNEGVSEILGTVLLFAIAIVLFSVLYLSLIPQLNVSSSMSTNIIGYIQDDSIILEHHGGESLSADASIQFIIGGSTTQLNISSDYLSDKNNNNKWDIGEKIVYPADLNGLQVETFVLNDDSNSALFYGVLQQGSIIQETEDISTMVESITPYNFNDSSLLINATSTGLIPDSVSLWYRFSTDNTSWEDFILFEIDYSQPWQWNFNFSNGSSYYEFYSIGEKTGLSDETAPETADAMCHYGGSQYTWVQSSQADFEAGTSINTDTKDSPGNVIIAQGSGYVYVFRGDDKDDFWRYNTTANTWTTMTDTPNDVDGGGALTNDGTYIYGLQGNDEKDFWRYNITSNTWTTMAEALEKIKEGGSLTCINNYIYALRGDDKKNFNRYDISEDSWEAMANTPEKVKWGGALVSDGDNNIYAFRGNDEKDFWGYNITSNTWTTMADTPENVLEGGSLTYDGSYIYGFRGDDEKDFWRYNITSNTWTTMADTPDDIKEGGSLTYDGNNYIYTLRGGDKKDFWRYNITSNTWTTMADTPNDVKSGGALTCIDSGGYLSSGSLTSSIKDCTFVANITLVNWDAILNGQTITMQIRSDDNADMSSPSSWETVTNGDTSISTPVNRYIQYKIILSTTDPSITPMLHDVTITYKEEG